MDDHGLKDSVLLSGSHEVDGFRKYTGGRHRGFIPAALHYVCCRQSEIVQLQSLAGFNLVNPASLVVSHFMKSPLISGDGSGALQCVPHWLTSVSPPAHNNSASDRYVL